MKIRVEANFPGGRMFNGKTNALRYARTYDCRMFEQVLTVGTKTMNH